MAKKIDVYARKADPEKGKEHIVIKLSRMTVHKAVKMIDAGKARMVLVGNKKALLLTKTR